MPFKSGEGRPPINISESELRYAISNTQSCMAAARFLNVSYESFRKYAKQYIDSESGKSLFDLHKNASGKGIKKAPTLRMNGKYGLNDILEGKHPNYNHKKLKDRLLRSGAGDTYHQTTGLVLKASPTG